MSKTTNLEIDLISRTDDFPVVDWAMKVNGDEPGSMAKILDEAYGNLNNREVYTRSRVTGQQENDIWHEILSVQ